MPDILKTPVLIGVHMFCTVAHSQQGSIREIFFIIWVINSESTLMVIQCGWRYNWSSRKAAGFIAFVQGVDVLPS